MRGWESQASGYKGQTVTPRTATALLRPGRACFRPFEAIRRQRHSSTLSHGVLALPSGLSAIATLPCSHGAPHCVLADSFAEAAASIPYNTKDASK